MNLSELVRAIFENEKTSIKNSNGSSGDRLSLIENLDFYIDKDHEPSQILDVFKKYFPEKVSSIDEHKFQNHLDDTDDTQKYYLSFKDDFLCILLGNQKPIKVDFLSPNLRKIFGQISKKDTFCKALGLKEEVKCIYDLTAGFGEDSFLAAKFVEQVVWVERNPMVCLLLEDGLRRLQKVYPELALKFKIIYNDGLEFLKETKLEDSSTIYFDFMFENKKSKSNKEMSFLKHITQTDSLVNINDYIKESAEISKKRIVLKAKDFDKVEIRPKHIYEGKTVKYFVFKT